MARNHFAKAIVSNTGASFEQWMDSQRDKHEGIIPKNQVHRIAKQMNRINPEQYLLSHATIVASVDTFAPKNVKLGKSTIHGCEIDVSFPDYKIKPETLDLVNNNNDCWSRPVIVGTYRTFLGAQNYLEHIQIPELSKGTIVDAVARDIGRSVYIDILVATDRKHKKLVADILSGEMNSLSMGCVSLFTICAKCGNVSVDDSTSCPCVRYETKGKLFVDEDGNQQKICELIGHISVPESNKFIEASWVKTPAFAGAVRRDLLNPEMIRPSIHTVQEAIELNSRYDLSHLFASDLSRFASKSRIAQDDQGGGSEDQGVSQDQGGPHDQGDSQQSGSQDQGQDSGESGESGSEDKLQVMIDKMQEKLMQGLLDGITDRLLQKAEVPSATVDPMSISSNDNLVRSASIQSIRNASKASISFQQSLIQKFPKSPKLTRWAASTWNSIYLSKKTASIPKKDLIIFSWVEDRIAGRVYPDQLYRVSMDVGPIDKFPSRESFHQACASILGRETTVEEKIFFITKAKIAAIGR